MKKVKSVFLAAMLMLVTMSSISTAKPVVVNVSDDDWFGTLKMVTVFYYGEDNNIILQVNHITCPGIFGTC